jgi:purine-binding chemotaxis protein CheW
MLDHTAQAPALDPGPAVRAELERRAVELARRVETTSAIETVEHVVFRIGSETYAVPASSVAAVFKLAEMAVLPGAPVHVRGLTLFKGQVLPVLDLRALIGARPDALTDLASVVALGSERAELGLLADSVEGIRSLAREDIHAAQRRRDAGRSPYVTGMTNDAVLLVDADGLIRFFHGGGP